VQATAAEAAKQMPPFSPALQVLKGALQLLINRYGEIRVAHVHEQLRLRVSSF